MSPKITFALRRTSYRDAVGASETYVSTGTPGFLRTLLTYRRKKSDGLFLFWFLHDFINNYMNRKLSLRAFQRCIICCGAGGRRCSFSASKHESPVFTLFSKNSITLDWKPVINHTVYQNDPLFLENTEEQTDKNQIIFERSYKRQHLLIHESSFWENLNRVCTAVYVTLTQKF